MIKYFVQKRKITLVFFVMLIIFGVFNALQLPKQLMPDIVVKTAIVTTTYPGATPELMEQTVTKILEQKIKEVANLDTISSTSSNGVSSITIQALPNANAEETWADLRRKVQDAQGELPADANTPIINDNLTQTFVQSFAVYGKTKEDIYALTDLMNTWRDQLRSVPGITDVDINGIPEQQVRINADMAKLKQYNISWETVMQAIQSENNRVPTGDIAYESRTYQLTVDESHDVNSLKNIVIFQTEAGIPVYLKDVADVQLLNDKETFFSYYNGVPAISMNINSETGSDVPTMSARVAEKMASLEKTLPANIKIESLFAQKTEVDRIFNDLIREMLIAIVAVIIICMLGLNMLTASFVALSIPVSIALGLCLLPILGISLNQITIIGLIIVLGILVDDAVVVNDNIERRLTVLKENPTDAAIKGTKEVSISIITATLATIAAFAPLMLLEGDMGSFIRPIPTIISLCMLASMIMSLTIIPIFREWYENRLIERGKVHDIDKPAGFLGRQIQYLTHAYSKKLMPKLLKRPLVIALSGLIISTLAYGLVLFTPIELFPSSSEAQLTISVSMPTGTSLQETDKVVRGIATWAKKQPGVDKIAYASGGAAPPLFSGSSSGSGVTSGQILITGIHDQLDVSTAASQWSDQLEKDYPGISTSVKASETGISVGKAVSIRILGDDLEEIRDLTNKVKIAIADTPGTYGITDSIGVENYALNFVVNKQAMDRYKVSYSNLTQTLLMMGSGMSVGDFDNGEDLIDMKIYMKGSTNASPNTLFQQVSITNSAGTQIPLSQVVEMKPSFSVQQIDRYNLTRVNTIEADVNGRTATEVMQELQPKIQQINFPEGYSWDVGGETSSQNDTFADLGRLFIVVIFLIIILIMIQFYSLSIPMVIMTTVYLAAAGGVLGLFITRTPIGFMSVMGIIALAGIVVRNGIVLIEFIVDARHEGMELTDAIITAASARFRPILLTSLTAIVGMIPIATVGELLFRPLGVTIIFGLIYSTTLTLVVVPSLYMVVARHEDKKAARKLERKQQRLDKINLNKNI